MAPEIPRETVTLSRIFKAGFSKVVTGHFTVPCLKKKDILLVHTRGILERQTSRRDSEKVEKRGSDLYVQQRCDSRKIVMFTYNSV